MKCSNKKSLLKTISNSFFHFLRLLSRVISYNQDRWSCLCAVLSSDKAMVKPSVGCPTICNRINSTQRPKYSNRIILFSILSFLYLSVYLYIFFFRNFLNLGEWIFIFFSHFLLFKYRPQK